MPGISVSKICVPFGGGGINWSSYWTQQYQDLLDYLTAQTIDEPSNADKLYQARWVKKMVDGGYWAKAEFLDLFSTPENMSLINWKAPGTRNPVKINTPAFVAYEGYKGSTATSSCIDTLFQANIHAAVSSQNSICMITGVGDNVSEDIEDVGVKDANNMWLTLGSKFVDGYSYHGACAGTRDNVGSSPGKAHFAVSRGLATHVDCYQNLAKTTRARNSAAFIVRKIYACGYNNNNTAVPNNKTIRYLFLFSYLTEAEVQGVINITEEYLQSVGTGLFF